MNPLNCQPQTDKLLSSWKEIASCLNRGVRTVQRWEQYGLPIRRPAGAGTNVVMAMESELHRWVRQWREKQNSNHDHDVERLQARLSVVKEQFREIDVRLAELQRRLDNLQPIELQQAS